MSVEGKGLSPGTLQYSGFGRRGGTNEHVWVGEAWNVQGNQQSILSQKKDGGVFQKSVQL